MVNGELSELEEGVGGIGNEELGMWNGEWGIGNGEWGIVGVGFDLTISEHSSFQIPHLTFDRSS
jgi:hypothetical protein